MVNALVISNNIYFIQKLVNEFNAFDLNIRINGVTTNKSETLHALKNLDFDIIFLDKSIIEDYNINFLDTHQSIIITLSYIEESNLITSIVLERINDFIDKFDTDRRKDRVVKELEYIGYKFKYKGTHYLVDTILQMHKKQHSMVDNLQTVIYPIIANKYNKTVYNIKSSINKATDCMYYECNSQKLARYFSFADDTKPTVKQEIFTVINKI